MDNSFIKLYDSLTEATSLGYNKTASLVYYTAIQLSPNETYLQISNNPNGISFEGNYTVEIVDICDNVLATITDHVFINEFTDQNGINQIAFEIVNISEDYYGRAVFIKFTHTISDVVYYSNALKITDKNLEETIRIDYTDYDVMNGVDYLSAPFYQSIRLNFKFINSVNNSEATEYYQISSGRNISTRYLEKVANAYLCEQLDDFTYRRLLRVFKNAVVYLDYERVTNKPLLETSEKKGQSNIFSSTFNAYLDSSDIYEFDYQIYEGFLLNELYPIDNGYYTLSNIDTDLAVSFNDAIIINTGTLTIYDASDDSIVASYTNSDLTQNDGVNFNFNGFYILDILGTGNDIGANGEYYVQFSSGLIDNTIGISFEGISDKTTWNFSIIDGMYEGTDYDNSEYLTD